MPICPECSTGFDDEKFCPKCGAKSPLETWPRPSNDTPKAEYGSFALFCLRFTQFLSFLSILGSIGCFLVTVYNWADFLPIIMTLISIPISIGTFIALGIAIRFAEEKNGTR